MQLGLGLTFFFSMWLVGTGTGEVKFPASLPAFVYEGRWLQSEDGSAKTDWPCASVRFAVQVSTGRAAIPIIWSNMRDRINATIIDSKGQVVSWSVFKGPAAGPPWKDASTSQWQLLLPVNRPGRYVIMLRKLTTAAPYGMGIASKLLSPSTVTLLGLGQLDSGVILESTLPRRERRMEFVGASDTAGFCVDGTPDMSPLHWGGYGWAYENCHEGFTGRLGDIFNAEVSVEAVSGIGMTQNAAASQQWQLGPLPMPGYFDRTLQTLEGSKWNFSSWVPNAVLISLGGNDYNHQGGHVPSNAIFTTKYEAFLDHVFDVYNHGTTVISICGMGSPLEKKQDPDNNRCRPCPHVENAVRAYIAKNADARLHYIFIPCDGSVATGHGDIGCKGHKNRRGQAEVARFLAPHIAEIMQWHMENTAATIDV